MATRRKPGPVDWREIYRQQSARLAEQKQRLKTELRSVPAL
jgi:hypothetical protein